MNRPRSGATDHGDGTDHTAIAARCMEPWMAMMSDYETRVAEAPGWLTIWAKDALVRVKRVCSALASGETGIPPRFEAFEAAPRQHRFKPFEAVEAERDRDAMLRLEGRALLETWMAGKADDEDTAPPIGEWMRLICQDPTPMPPGLEPVRVPLVPSACGTGAEMEAWLEAHVGPLLFELERVYPGAGFAHLVPTRAAPDARSAWCHAWTRATVAIATEWLVRNGENDLRAVLRALWDGTLPRFNARGPQGKRRISLPTNQPLQIDLLANPVLCQILEHDNAHWAAAALGHVGRVRLTLKTLDYQPTRGRVLYRGRNIGQIHLALWNDRFAHVLAHLQGHTYMPTVATDLPAALAHQLAPGQWPTASALLRAINTGPSQPPIPPRWFAQPGEQRSLDAISPTHVRNLPGHHLVLPQDDAALRHDQIGHIRLPWAMLNPGPEPRWLDVALIVREHGEWFVLAVDLEDDDAEPAQADEEIVALSVLPVQLARWPVDRLRTALVCAPWRFRNAGLGVFLTGALDLDRVD